MARKLPPFASVRVFEAAARHCSFKKAAKELTLTPSAISHQVKSLEDFFGHMLFYRRRSSLELTAAGEEYLQELTKILDHLEIATERVLALHEKSGLTIHLFPSLASTWLVARISSLRTEHPDINVRIVTSHEPLDFKFSEVDFAIQYLRKRDVGKIVKPGFHADLLFDETMIPVCSKEYIDTAGSVNETSDILNNSLILCETGFDEWQQWCSAVGIVYSEPPQRTYVDSRALALRAAVDGLGIAMGRTPFHDDYVAKERLVTPFPFELVTGYAYYLIYSKRKAQMLSMRKCRNWLLKISSEHRLKAVSATGA